MKSTAPNEASFFYKKSFYEADALKLYMEICYYSGLSSIFLNVSCSFLFVETIYRQCFDAKSFVLQLGKQTHRIYFSMNT